jgi:hypothetical protein
MKDRYAALQNQTAAELNRYRDPLVCVVRIVEDQELACRSVSDQYPRATLCLQRRPDTVAFEAFTASRCIPSFQSCAPTARRRSSTVLTSSAA